MISRASRYESKFDDTRHMVDVLQTSAQELRDKGETGADADRTWCQPLHALDRRKPRTDYARRPQASCAGRFDGLIADEDTFGQSPIAGRVSPRLGPDSPFECTASAGYTETFSVTGFGTLEPVGQRLGNSTVPVSDRGTLGSLTQFATQFGFAGSATSL